MDLQFEKLTFKRRALQKIMFLFFSLGNILGITSRDAIALVMASIVIIYFFLLPISKVLAICLFILFYSEQYIRAQKSNKEVLH